MNEFLQRLTAPEWAEFARSGSVVLLIVALAWLALRLARRLIPVLRDRLTGRIDDLEQRKRVATLVRALRYARGELGRLRRDSSLSVQSGTA